MLIEHKLLILKSTILNIIPITFALSFNTVNSDLISHYLYGIITTLISRLHSGFGTPLERPLLLMALCRNRLWNDFPQFLCLQSIAWVNKMAPLSQKRGELFLFMYVYVYMCVCECMPCVCDVCRGQKRALDLLQLEFRQLCATRYGCKDLTQVLQKSSKCS